TERVPRTLRTCRAPVFSKRAVSRASVRAQQARRDLRVVGCSREQAAVCRRGDAVGAGEARGERADALQPDVDADARYRAVRVPQQRGGALEPPGQQVRVGRLAEGAAELAAEVGAREAGGAGEVLDAQRFEVPGVGKVLGPEQVTRARY